MFILAYICVAEYTIPTLTIMCLISSQAACRCICHSLEKEQSLMCVNMSEAHWQKKLSSLLAIFICHLMRCWPAVSLRLLCEGSTPGWPHLSVSCTRYSFWLFPLSSQSTVNRCLHLMRPKGQIQRKNLHHNQPLQIQQFTLAQEPSSHHLQAAPPRLLSSHACLEFSLIVILL